MDTLEKLGKRIATTKDLQSIVRTMKSLSSVSIRQYEQAATALGAYNQTIEHGFQALLREMPLPKEEMHPADLHTAAIVFGSDHGLCGQFNEQICRFATEEMQKQESRADERVYLAVGMQVATRLGTMNESVDDVISLPGAVRGLTAMAHTILHRIDEWLTEDRVGRVLLFRNARTAEAVASPAMIQLLPLDIRWLHKLASQPWPSRVLPMHRMDGNALFSALVRKHLFASIFRAAAESTASEHATRLASMQAAERNIQEHLQEMTSDYRRHRQQAITEELLDVVAGFETLQPTDATDADRDF